MVLLWGPRRTRFLVSEALLFSCTGDSSPARRCIPLGPYTVPKASSNNPTVFLGVGWGRLRARNPCGGGAVLRGNVQIEVKRLKAKPLAASEVHGGSAHNPNNLTAEPD